jgi:hypothetical protein
MAVEPSRSTTNGQRASLGNMESAIKRASNSGSKRHATEKTPYGAAKSMDFGIFVFKDAEIH